MRRYMQMRQKAFQNYQRAMQQQAQAQAQRRAKLRSLYLQRREHDLAERRKHIAAQQQQGSKTKSSPTNSGGSEADRRSLFKRIDTNKDGKLSKQEVRLTLYASQFDKLDGNHDGQLTLQELLAPVAAAPKKSK